MPHAVQLKIRDTLSRRPALRLVENDTAGICERIKEIEKEYFIVRNMLSGDYEVHSTLNDGNTFCFAVPYDRLDARTLEYCRKTRTGRDVALAVEKNNARIEASEARAMRNSLESRAYEMRDYVSYGVECGELHEGYRRTVSMGG